MRLTVISPLPLANLIVGVSCILIAIGSSSNLANQHQLFPQTTPSPQKLNAKIRALPLQRPQLLNPKVGLPIQRQRGNPITTSEKLRNLTHTIAQSSELAGSRPASKRVGVALGSHEHELGVRRQHQFNNYNYNPQQHHQYEQGQLMAPFLFGSPNMVSQSALVFPHQQMLLSDSRPHSDDNQFLADLYLNQLAAGGNHIAWPANMELQTPTNRGKYIKTSSSQTSHHEDSLMPSIQHQSQASGFRPLAPPLRVGSLAAPSTLLERPQMSEELRKKQFSPRLAKSTGSQASSFRDETQGSNSQAQVNHPAAPIFKDKRASRISNEQLMLLIDELKELNEKQDAELRAKMLLAASRKVSSPKEASNDEDSSKSNDDDSDDQSDEDQKEESQDETKRAEVGRTHPDAEKPKVVAPKLTPEELAKFAKFLMTREGLNLRFQLGLDRDAPDDGDHEDDDERDSLLEGRKRKSERHLASNSSALNSSKFDDMDQKHKEVASQIDGWIDSLSKRTKEAERAKLVSDEQKSATPTKSDDDNDRDSGQSGERQRRHRAQTSRDEPEKSAGSESRSVAMNSKISEKIRPRDGENFARNFIKQELLEDQLESQPAVSAAASTGINEEPSKRKRRSRPGDNFDSEDDDDDSERDTLIKRTSKLASRSGKAKNEHGKMVARLERARGNQAALRSRLPLGTSSQSLVRRALNGEFALRAKRDPDDKLRIHSNKKTVMEVDLPQAQQVGVKRMSLQRPTNEVKPSSHWNPDEDPKTSEQVSVQVEPTGAKSAAIEQQKEYPISEQLSDRLGKLSNSLDRYFEDGFMQAVDTKSNFNGKSNDKEARDSMAHPSVSGQSAASNESDKIVNEVAGVDHDFDVDVGIDGKRDDQNDNDIDSDVQDSSKAQEEDKKSRQAKRPDTPNRKTTKVKTSSQKPEVKKNRPKHAARIAKVDTKSREASVVSTEGPRSVKLEDEKSVEFEKSGDLDRVLDPVDSETMETPIGPDGETAILTGGSKTKTVQKKNFVAQKGPKKFFEESDWP